MNGHPYTEDVDDCSMCVCGIPGLTHAQVVNEPQD